MFPRGVLMLIVVAASLSHAAVKLGDFITPCSIKASNLDECMTEKGRTLLPHLVHGIKEWDVLPMDPLFVPHMELQRNTGGSLGISIKVFNSTQYGWKDMDIQSITMDPKSYTFTVKWRFPKYVMLGESESSGRVILLPISGSGPANITFLNVNVEMKMKTVPEEQGGKKYLKVKEANTAVTVEKLFLQIDNLFNNAQLSTTMNKILNDNSMDIFEELKPNIQEIFSDILAAIIGRIFSKVPLNKLFTDME